MEENFQNDGGQIDTQDTNNLEAGSTDNLDNSASDNVDSNITDSDNIDSGNGNNGFDIPQEYKEKDWVKQFEGKTGDELQNAVFKALDEKYANEPYIPETVEDYALNELEFKDENGNVTYEYPQEVLDVFGGKFKEAGLTKEQAHGLLKDYTQFELEQFEAISNIDDLNNLGIGVGRIDGWVVMVPYALAGERVKARVYKNHKKIGIIVLFWKCYY